MHNPHQGNNHFTIPDDYDVRREVIPGAPALQGSSEQILPSISTTIKLDTLQFEKSPVINQMNHFVFQFRGLFLPH
jgi:hypothetical protein